MNRHATGDPDLAWWLHLRHWRGRPFRRALSLNCGNGWVERQLLEHGVVESAIGIDIADDLLDQARGEAATRGLPIEYRRVDINTDDLGAVGEFDLVVNHAAAHHIAFIDRVFRQLCRLLPDDGVLVSYDYVGAHRNQYPTQQWEAIWRANEDLRPELRKRLRYPTVSAVVASDPTEAIHSELIVPTMRRYFDLEIANYVGGAVAYDILTFNDAFFDPSVDTHHAVMQVLAADAEYRAADPAANSLFAYLVATPREGRAGRRVAARCVGDGGVGPRTLGRRRRRALLPGDDARAAVRADLHTRACCLCERRSRRGGRDPASWSVAPSAPPDRGRPARRPPGHAPRPRDPTSGQRSGMRVIRGPTGSEGSACTWTSTPTKHSCRQCASTTSISTRSATSLSPHRCCGASATCTTWSSTPSAISATCSSRRLTVTRRSPRS